MNELDTDFDSDPNDMSNEMLLNDFNSEANTSNKKIDAKRRVEQYLEEKALLRMLEEDY